MQLAPPDPAREGPPQCPQRHCPARPPNRQPKQRRVRGPDTACPISTVRTGSWLDQRGTNEKNMVGIE